jgi:hypothetical protein
VLSLEKESHPSWTGTSPAQAPVEQSDPNALAREQDLHRVAAARQLETLEKIEEGLGGEEDGEREMSTINETYIPVDGVK